MKYIKSTQEILKILDIKDKILLIQNNIYSCIIQVYPINYNSKTEYEKRQIKNQYSTFLKSIDSNFQILIKTKKQKIEGYFNNLNGSNLELIQDYKTQIYNKFNNVFFIKEYYVVFSYRNVENYSFEKIKNILNDKINIAKNELEKCGNKVNDFFDYSNEEFIMFLSSFFNEKENLYEL